MTRLLPFLLASCVGFEPLTGDSGTATSTGTEETVTSYGGMAFPASLDLGQVVVGEDPATADLTLTNESSDNVKMTEVAFEASADFEAVYTSVPWVVGPGGQYVISLTFDPSTAGVQTATLSFGVEGEDGLASVEITAEGLTDGGGTTDGGATGDGGGSGDGGSDGALSLSSTAVAFGYVTPGSSDFEMVTVTNTGSSGVLIRELRSSSPAVTATGISTPVVLSGGSSQSLQITFSPTDPRPYSETVTIDADIGNTTITVTGTGEEECKICAPVLSVDAGTQLSFESSFGAVDRQTVTLSNDGDRDLQITGISLTNDSGGGTFELVGASATTLAATASTTFDVSYRCEDALCLDLPNDAVDTNILHITSNDPTNPDWAIELVGE